MSTDPPRVLGVLESHLKPTSDVYGHLSMDAANPSPWTVVLEVCKEVVEGQTSLIGRSTGRLHFVML